MLITFTTTRSVNMPWPRERVWQIMHDLTLAPGQRWAAGPAPGEVGSTVLLELPATGSSFDGLPVVYTSTVLQLTPGHMSSCRIVGPLLEQREVWLLRDDPQGCAVSATAHVQASAAVYDESGLQARTQQLLDYAIGQIMQRGQHETAA